MTTRNYSSRSQQTTLTGAVTSGATSIVVVSGSALLGGVTIPAGTTFTIVIDPDTALEEIVDATAVSTNTFTVTRAIDGSSAQAHSAGAVVRHMAIGRDYREANTHIEASTGVHGISNSSSVVGTIDTQTLTNKTLTSPTITNPTISGTNVDASIVFEGATPDAFETTLTVTDPTQDNTITLPNTTGTVVLATATQTLTNKTMGDALNAGGFKITNLATPTLASDAVRKDFADAQVAAAATSATSAATSATSAAASATTAANSVATIAGYATSSANSATAAATSATSAAASATAAATSATSAAASAVSAASSATAAATSAASAAVSATAAATSATSASASATAAATSATSAAASATASANSASASATSATASASSASAAATSASSAATSASSAATSATNAETAWDSFDDRYLGPKSSAPTVDNDGNPLTNGVLYYNTTSGVMFVYNGTTSAWEQVAVSTSGFPTLSGNNTFTGTNTFNNDVVIAESGTGDALRITNTGTGNSLLVEDSANPDSTPFIVDATGNVGIGATPTNLLTVIGSTSGQIIGAFANNNTGVNAVVLRSGATGANWANTLALQNYTGTTTYAEMRASADSQMGLFTNGSERMRIDSAGNVGIGGSTSGNVRFLVTGTPPLISLQSTGILGYNTFNSTGTTAANQFYSLPSTTADASTISAFHHFRADNVTLGAGSAISTQYGFSIPSSFTSATNNIGFYGNIAASANRYNFYAAGTAANYFAGRTGIGAALTSGAMAQVVNTTAADIGFVVKGAASQTGDLLQIQNSAGTVLATVTSAGNVGIGTSSPKTKLHTTGTSSASMPALGTASGSLYVTNTDTTYGLLAGVSSSTGEVWFQAQRTDGTATAYNLLLNPSGGSVVINAVADATTTTAARGGGYMGIPASAASGSGAYTVVAGDAGEHIYTTTTRTVTIPANASVAFPVGTVLSFISGVGATTTIAITSDTMYLAGAGTTGSRTLAAHGMATAVKVASTTWYISGNGLT